ncbi:MAG: amidohydrolase family protein, partial [Gammaproteobacteria bacterium]|nr:amidohydrolase family protein [Gammaproteobacteria bacterium]
MQTRTRRQFLALLAAASAQAAQTRPDTILHNATIHTVDARQPRAHAIAIAGDRLLAVGGNDDVLNLATANTKKIDLSGKTVVPGFIDAHTHPVYSGIRHLRWVDCDLRSIRKIQQAVREKAA